MHFIHEGIGYSEEHIAKVARTRYEEKKLDEHRKRAGHTVESPIVLSDEGDEDENDTTSHGATVKVAAKGRFRHFCYVVVSV